jgi:putative nucleotidyltransferase with HDIG domain
MLQLVLYEMLVEMSDAPVPSEVVKYHMAALKEEGSLPELFDAIGCTQNAHHVDDVFGHTMAVLDGCEVGFFLRIAALFHDLGKPATRTETNGKISFLRHEDVSAEIAVRGLPPTVGRVTAWLCANHMRLKAAKDSGTGMSDKALLKLRADAPDEHHFNWLLQLCHADNCAHAPASCMPNQVPNLRRIYEELATRPPVAQKPGKPIQAMFDHYFTSRRRVDFVLPVLRNEQATLEHRVNFLVRDIADHFTGRPHEGMELPPDQYDNFCKAFRSRATDYIQSL